MLMVCVIVIFLQLRGKEFHANGLSCPLGKVICMKW